jgi:hypothetical protein
MKRQRGDLFGLVEKENKESSPRMKVMDCTFHSYKFRFGMTFTSKELEKVNIATVYRG